VTVVPETLDVHKMQAAAENLLGEHDFSAFCANAKMKKSTVRFIRSLEVKRLGNEIHITVTGNGFLQGMVRIITGTLLEVGMGQRKAESIPDLFGAKRAEAGFMAPPQGLCLVEVFY
jgi:tRNA pseudouridine38-40 synthase